MLRAMVTYLLENGKIETTLARAKEVRSMAEKMITLGKRDDLTGFKENVIMGNLIPAGTGLAAYRKLKVIAEGETFPSLAEDSAAVESGEPTIQES